MRKVVLITGASSGIGKETAVLLVNNGYVVYGAARRVDKMNDLQQKGVNVIKMDVTDDTSMVAGIEHIIRKEGKIDILVNNAGYGLYGAIEDVPMADARYQMEVNLFGLARLTQLILSYMREQRSGKIVNVSSIGGKIATPLGGWYYASKFAVEGLSDSLRVEVKPFGIDVILIEPGGVKTEWGSIAVENLQKTAQNSAYRKFIDKANNFFDQIDDGFEPLVIAELIKEAVEAKHPRVRYVKGKMAGFVLFCKKCLSDRFFDKMMLRQFKME